MSTATRAGAERALEPPGAATAVVQIRHFTDPSCPFAFSAERQRMRVKWLYGERIEWELHMVVLSEEPPPAELVERFAASHKKLQARYGMPIDWRPRARPSATAPACRAVVAARLHAPEREEALLRRLRVRYFAGGILDDPDLIDAAAADVGLHGPHVRAWSAEPAVEAALRADMEAARSPSPAARAQDDRLGGPPERRRYTCPSYELLRTAESPPDWPCSRRLDLPGFRPVEAYEAAIANLAPELERRKDPRGVEEVLHWAAVPLATAEVAAVCDADLADVRVELARVARFEPLGADGYWSLA